jgi:hypothetical protein
LAQAADALPSTPSTPAASPTPANITLRVAYDRTVTVVTSPAPTFTPTAVMSSGLTAANAVSASFDANGLTVRFASDVGDKRAQLLATVPAKTAKNGRGFRFGSGTPARLEKSLAAGATNPKVFVMRIFPKDTGTKPEQAPFVTVQVADNHACFVYGNPGSGVRRDESDAADCTFTQDTSTPAPKGSLSPETGAAAASAPGAAATLAPDGAANSGADGNKGGNDAAKSGEAAKDSCTVDTEGGAKGKFTGCLTIKYAALLDFLAPLPALAPPGATEPTARYALSYEMGFADPNEHDIQPCTWANCAELDLDQVYDQKIHETVPASAKNDSKQSKNGQTTQPLINANLAWASRRTIEASGAAKISDLSFLSQQTSAYLTSISKDSLLSNFCEGNDACASASSSDDFKNLDVRFFNTIQAPTRPGTLTKVGKLETDLKPIDLSTVTNVNFGTKLTAQSPNGDFLGGLVWFHDIDAGGSGSAAHFEGGIPPLSKDGIDAMNAGITIANANAVTPLAKNYYIPTTLEHTNNTVLSMLFHPDPNAFTSSEFRYGISNGSKDEVFIESFSESLQNANADDDSWAKGYFTPRAEAGYRSLDLGYTPLYTTYDPFVGTRSAFISLGETFSDPTAKSTQFNDTSASLTWSRDAGPAYYDFAVTTNQAVTKGGFGLSGTYDRSLIAWSIVSRIDPSKGIPSAGTAGNLLDNDTKSANLTYKTDNLLTATVSAKLGVAWNETPSCSATPPPKKKASIENLMAQATPIPTVTCKVDDSRKTTAAVVVSRKNWNVDFNLGPAKDIQADAGQKSVPTSEIVANGVFTLQAIKCADVTASYSNNAAAQTTQAFVKGVKYESSAEVPLFPGTVGQVEYSLTYAPSSAAIARHALAFNVIFGDADKGAKNLITRCTANNAGTPKKGP